MDPRRFLSLLVKESIQFFRDKIMLGLILFLYLGETIMCTVALSYDVKDVPLAIVDLDQTPASRSLIESFLVAPEFRHAGWPSGTPQLGEWLDSGRTTIGIIIPNRFQSDIQRRVAPQVQVLLDGSNSNTAVVARGYVLNVLSRFEALSSAPLPVRSELRVWYNQNMTFSSFMVLSMIALAAMLVGVIQPAASIVREKEVGTVEQLLVTPITTSELFIAKTLPTVFLGLIAIFPSLLIAYWFQVPLRGSLFLFLALTALFLVSAISLGVVIAAWCRTLQQALLMSFMILFPVMFLSGTLVPVESMPRALQLLSLLSPLRYYMDITLGVFLKGSGPHDLWQQAAGLAAIGATLFTFAATSFRRL